jgi:hypothetical protein
MNSKITAENTSFNLSFSLQNSIDRGSTVSIKISKNRIIMDTPSAVKCNRITAVTQTEFL